MYNIAEMVEEQLQAVALVDKQALKTGSMYCSPCINPTQEGIDLYLGNS